MATLDPTLLSYLLGNGRGGVLSPLTGRRGQPSYEGPSVGRCRIFLLSEYLALTPRAGSNHHVR